MLFCCDLGHKWRAVPYNVLKGSWCPHPNCCGPRISRGRAAKTLESQCQRIIEIVEQRRGKWLRGEYKNNSTPLDFACQNGHLFSMRPDNVFQGSWCPRCVGKIPAAERLAELRQIAIARGGELLSQEYKSKQRLQWKCAEGHTWWSSSGSVRDQQSWCPHCAGTALLDEGRLAAQISVVASQKGGKLLGLSRQNTAYGKRIWSARLICASGHTWDGRMDHLLNGHWCPTCNMPGIREKICRQVLEHLLSAKFPKRRPSWLSTARGKRAELDGYNEKLRLAFEYHGQQHYTYIPFFHSGDKSLQRREEDDRLKRETCGNHGVTLIEVNIDIPLEDLQSHLTDQIVARRPELALSLNKMPFEIATARTGKDEDLKELQKVAEGRNGKCLSVSYIDNSTKMRWQCSEGHQWFASAASVKHNGTWCPECKGKRISESRRTPIQDVERLCNGLSLRLHGTDLKASRLYYVVSCNSGHTWLTDLKRLKDGRGCQKCSAKISGDRLKLTLEQVQASAAARGGRLLSQRYQRSGVRLLWECGTGHRWLANANSIRSGSWCPVCAGRHGNEFKGDIEEFLRAELEA